MTYTNNGRSLIDVVSVFLVLPTIAVLLVFAARWKQRRIPLPSDYFVVASYLLHVAFCACLFAAVNNPYGSIETTEIPLTDVTVLNRTVKLLFVNSVLLVGIIFFAKVSLCLFYNTIFATPTFRKATAVVIGLTTAWFFAFFFLVIFRCNPVRGSWDVLLSAQPDVCLDYGNIVLAFELFNSVGDIIIIALPIRELLKLQMPTAKKIGLSALFALGLFVIATSVIRITVSWGRQILPFTRIMIWTTVQQACCIIAACLPSFPALVPDRVKSSVRSTRDWFDTKLSGTGTRSSQSAANKLHSSSQEGTNLQQPDNELVNLIAARGYTSSNTGGKGFSVHGAPANQINVQTEIDVAFEPEVNGHARQKGGGSGAWP